MKDHKRFEKFLSKIELDTYREQYQKVKIVELNMPKNIQPLHHLYQEYWEKRSNWCKFEDFYETYKKDLLKELERFRKKAGFSKETFYRGLPARIYRTWASLLTQIQGAYVAEEIYGKGKVEMSVSNDQQGKDIIFELPSYGRLPVQIKKKSRRPEARKSSTKKMIFVEYEVPLHGELTKTGKKSVPYKRWHTEWSDRLIRLDNGFIIFKKEMFELQNLLRGILEDQPDY